MNGYFFIRVMGWLPVQFYFDFFLGLMIIFSFSSKHTVDISAKCSTATRKKEDVI
jgi:hypothetical protein